VHEPDEIAAGHTTMQLLSEGNGDVMMKGLISSDKFLKCMLDKEYGLMIPDAILTSVSIAEIPDYHKLLIFADAAFIPAPISIKKLP